MRAHYKLSDRTAFSDLACPAGLLEGRSRMVPRMHHGFKSLPEKVFPPIRVEDLEAQPTADSHGRSLCAHVAMPRKSAHSTDDFREP